MQKKKRLSNCPFVICLADKFPFYIYYKIRMRLSISLN